MGIEVHGESPYQTTYIRFGEAVGTGVAKTDHVMYERGLRMTAAEGAVALARVVEPYFDRTYQHFSSHAQTPPVKNASRYAAAVRNGQVITIAYPIFKAYGMHANLPYRQLVQNCIDLLMPRRLVEAAGPSTIEVTLMRRPGQTIVHLLQFVAERRTDVLDVVEDVAPLYNVALSVRADAAPRRVMLAPSRQELEFEYRDGRVHLVVPVVDGHQMVVVL